MKWPSPVSDNKSFYQVSNDNLNQISSIGSSVRTHGKYADQAPFSSMCFTQMAEYPFGLLSAS